MATIDVTISDAQYAQLTTVLDVWKTRLEPLRVPLGKLLGNDKHRQRVIDFIQSDDGRLLKTTLQTYRWLDQFMDNIGLEEND